MVVPETRRAAGPRCQGQPSEARSRRRYRASASFPRAWSSPAWHRRPSSCWRRVSSCGGIGGSMWEWRHSTRTKQTSAAPLPPRRVHSSSRQNVRVRVLDQELPGVRRARAKTGAALVGRQVLPPRAAAAPLGRSGTDRPPLRSTAQRDSGQPPPAPPATSASAFQLCVLKTGTLFNQGAKGARGALLPFGPSTDHRPARRSWPARKPWPRQWARQRNPTRTTWASG